MVSGAVPGDVVNARVKKSKSKYFEAEAIEILEKSPYRVEPKCIHFGVCGCKWQNLSYQKQLDFKQEEVYNNIKRIGGIENFETPILGSEQEYFYRNKMEFSFLMLVGLLNTKSVPKKISGIKMLFRIHIPGNVE